LTQLSLTAVLVCSIRAWSSDAPEEPLPSPRRPDRRRVLYGNAVTPTSAEILISALVEAIGGEPLSPASNSSSEVSTAGGGRFGSARSV
jgi:hypothetical protein